MHALIRPSLWMIGSRFTGRPVGSANISAKPEVHSAKRHVKCSNASFIHSFRSPPPRPFFCPARVLCTCPYLFGHPTGSSPHFPPPPSLPLPPPLQSYQIIVYKSALHQAPDWSATSAPREASVVLHGAWGSSGALALSTGTCVAAGLGMRPFTSEEQPDVFQVWMCGGWGMMQCGNGV